MVMDTSSAQNSGESDHDPAERLTEKSMVIDTTRGTMRDRAIDTATEREESRDTMREPEKALGAVVPVAEESWEPRRKF